MILVTGGNGLVANGIKLAADSDQISQLFFASRDDANLESFEECKKLFEKVQPDVVVHLAAYVGGLYHNIQCPVEFFEKNMLMQINIMRCCKMFNVKRVISCLSTCIFPNEVTYPIDESMLHNGKPHHSNYAYAYSKRMGDVLNQAYAFQYGMDCISICPTNIFGPHDNFSIANGHVIPALIHKCHISNELCVMGSGSAFREFIYNVDLGKIILRLVNKDKITTKILICSPSVEISIGNVAEIIAKHFNKPLSYDKTKSDGQFRKNTCNSALMTEIGDFEFTDFDVALKHTIQWFKANFDTCRK